ncbi:hypothetical protein HK102_000127 [Quaeritorhiza haematococci]|nr:hypothetical protein HK102_000127 [Quaeritorhiza haematococci]
MFGSDMMESQAGPDGKIHVKLDPNVEKTTFNILMEFLYNGYLENDKPELDVSGQQGDGAKADGNADDGNRGSENSDVSKDYKPRKTKYRPVFRCLLNSKHCQASSTLSRLYELPVPTLIQLAYLCDRYLLPELANLCGTVLKIHLSNVTRSHDKLPMEDILILADKLNLKDLMDELILRLTYLEFWAGDKDEAGPGTRLGMQLAQKGEFELSTLVINKLMKRAHSRTLILDL